MTYQSTVLGFSPVLYYRLNESSGTTATDLGSQAANGTYNNSPTLGATSPISDGTTAVAFASATSQDMRTTFFSGLNITTFTLMAWVKGTGNNQVICGRQGTSSAPYFMMIDSTGRLRLSIRTTGTSGPDYIATTGTINDGAWHFVAVTRDNTSGDIKFYVDGSLVTTTSATSAPGTATSFGFAVASRGGTPFLNGSVDEVALFSSALSGSDISAIYAAASSVDRTITPPAATATADGAAPTVSGTANATVTPPAATASAAALAPVVTGTGDVTITAPAATANAASLAPMVSTTATIASPAATSSAAGLAPTVTGQAHATVLAPAATANAAAIEPFISNDSPDATIHPPSATATATALAPLVLTVVSSSTDTSNILDGLDLAGTATVTVSAPVATPPFTANTVRVDKAVALPNPVLVKGRPT